MLAPTDFQTFLRPYILALDYTDLAQKGGKNKRKLAQLHTERPSCS